VRRMADPKCLATVACLAGEAIQTLARAIVDLEGKLSIPRAASDKEIEEARGFAAMEAMHAFGILLEEAINEYIG